MLTLLLPLIAVAQPAPDPLAHLPMFHRQTMVTEVTEPMHWFDASFLETEWAGCRVGIPAVPAREAAQREPRIGCWFPSGRLETERPADPELRRHFRLAKKAVRRSNRGLSHLDVAYVGTWKQVDVLEVIPVPAGDNPYLDRMYWTGSISYAVTDEGIEQAPLAGIVSFGGRGAPPDVEDPWYLEVSVPPEVAGTPVLLAMHHVPDDERVQAAERAVRQAVLEALPAIEAGEPSPPPREPSAVLPQDVRRTLAWQVKAYARPPRDEAGRPVIDQVTGGTTFTVPLDVALEGPVRWTHREPALGLTMQATLDLSGQSAALALSAADGSTVQRTYAFEVELVEDGEAAYATVTGWQDQALPPDSPPHRGHELPAAEPYVHLDVHPEALEQTPFAWTGGEGSYERVQADGEAP